MPAPSMFAVAIAATVTATAVLGAQEADAADLRITTTGSLTEFVPGPTGLGAGLIDATSFEVVYRVNVDEQPIGNLITAAEWRNQEALGGSSIVSLVLRDANGDVLLSENFDGGGNASGSNGQLVDRSNSLALRNDMAVAGGTLDGVAMRGVELRGDGTGFLGVLAEASRLSQGPDDTMFAAADGVDIAAYGAAEYDLGSSDFDMGFLSLRSESFAGQGMILDFAAEGTIDRIQFAVVPVPAPVLLGGLGLLAAGAARRRFNRG